MPARVRRCEKLARQAKPPAPPTLQTLAQQGRWGRRFRLRGRRNQFFTPSQYSACGLLWAGCRQLLVNDLVERGGRLVATQRNPVDVKRRGTVHPGSHAVLQIR